MIKAILLPMLFISNLTSTYYLFYVGTYGVSMIDITNLFLVIYSLYRYFWLGKPFVLPPFSHYSWIFGLTVSVIFSVAVPLFSGSSEMQIQWIKTTLHYLYVVFIGITIVGINFNSKEIFSTFKIHIGLSLFISLFGIYQIFARAFDLPFAWIVMSSNVMSSRGGEMQEWGQLSLQFGSFFRATSIFPEPSSLAAYTIQILTLILCPFFIHKGTYIKNRIFIAVIVIVNIIALFATFSLTGILLSGILIVLYLFKEQKISLRGFLIFFIIVTSIIIFADYLAFQYFETSVLELFFQRAKGIYEVLFTSSGNTTGGESFFGRLETMIRAFRIWVEYPITGYGIGCIFLYDRVNQLTYIDSTLFSILAEIGLLGILSFVGLNISMFIFLFKTIEYQLKIDLLSVQTQRLLAVLPYLFITQIAVLFTTSFLVTVWMYQLYGIIVSVVNAAYLESGIELRKISFIHEPLRDRLLNGIQRLRVS